MSIKTRVLAFLTCLMLGVSMISPAFVRADDPTPTPTLTPEEEHTLINGLTYDQWVTGAELLNKFFFGYVLNTGDSFDAGDYIDAISLLDDIYEQQTHSSGGHRFASDDQINYLDNALQMGIMGYDTLDNLLNDYPMTVNDLAGAARGRGIYSQGINNITESAPEQYAPYLNRLSLSDLQLPLAASVKDLSITPDQEQYITYTHVYNPSDYTLIANNSYPEAGTSSIFRRGYLDYISVDPDTGLPLHTMDDVNGAYKTDSAWENTSFYYQTRTNASIATLNARYAILIEPDPSLSTAATYSGGHLQQYTFSAANDNIRLVSSIDSPLSSSWTFSKSNLTADISYYNSNTQQTTVRNKRIGNSFACGYPYQPLTPCTSDTGKGGTSLSVRIQTTSTDPLPTYDDFTKILYFLPGYFRNVDVYVGTTWETAEPFVGPRGWSVTPPTTYVDPISGNDMGPIEAPSGGTINLYQFMLWFLQQDWKNRTVTINNITNNVNIMTPPSTQDNPTPTPQTTILYTPVDIDINQNNTFDFSDNYFNGDDDGDGEKNHIPYSIDIGDLNVWDGDSDDGGFGLWSKPIPDWDGNRITPAPVVEVGTRSYRAVASAEQEDLTMSPAGSAYTLVKAGAAFIGPIAPYIWFIVGALVVVSLVVRLLHG